METKPIVRYAYNLTFEEVIELMGKDWKKYVYPSKKES
jgi:hypothetical protein